MTARWRQLLALGLCAALLLGAAPATACPGDCDGDGTVRINELVAGVGIALGQAPVAGCAAADANGDGQVLIGELIAATNALLSGCPAGSPTHTPPAAPTATPSPSPTATVNLPPALATPFAYRGYVGQPIARPLGAVDPNGDPLTCAAEGLLAGMVLGDDQVLRWTPTTEQIGVVSLPVQCADDADPPLAGAGVLDFRIAPLDACTTPVCDPAAGCSASLPPLEQDCCAGAAPVRLPEAPVHCPHGALLQVGRNVGTGGAGATFGRLYNCDRLQFRERAQTDAEVRLHVRVACLNVNNRIFVSARLESAARGVVFSADQPGAFFTEETAGGTAQRRNFVFPFNVSGPFLDLEDTEATLTVTARDVDGLVVSETLRVIIASTPLDDLPESD